MEIFGSSVARQTQSRWTDNELVTCYRAAKTLLAGRVDRIRRVAWLAGRVHVGRVWLSHSRAGPRMMTAEIWRETSATV